MGPEEHVEQALEDLGSLLEEGAQVRHYRRPPPRAAVRPHPRPTVEPEERPRLPGLSGRWSGRNVTVDLSWWQEKQVQLTIFVEAKGRFRLALSASGGRAMEFGRPLHPTTATGVVHSDLESRFAVETADEEEARTFLADSDVEKAITQLGDFERLSMDVKFVKLSRLLDTSTLPSGEALHRDVAALAFLAGKLE